MAAPQHDEAGHFPERARFLARHELFRSLTPRELEILKHLAEGQSNKAIGRALDITDGTVKLHVKSILRKLGVRSRVEAAVLAVEHGLGRKPTVTG